MKRAAPQSAQSVPLSQRATAPNWASEPGPPSWHKPLFAYAHVLVHHIGGGEGGDSSDSAAAMIPAACSLMSAAAGTTLARLSVA